MLVSAPAGFGKTTLLAEWLAAGPAAPTDERPVAWVSLDRGDNHPGVLLDLRHRRAADGGARRRRGRARAPAGSPSRRRSTTVLTTLLNDLGDVDGDIVLVLDDYHVIDAPEVQEGMAFLLDHVPPRLHLVIAGRADPALPLARLRARGELVEVRAADLRFTPEEAVAYLNGVMGLRADGCGRGGAGGAHRGVDRRAAAGGAVDAGPGRRRRLHRRLRRRRPVRRRLPGRGGAGSGSPTPSRPSCCRPPSSTGSAVRCATPSPADDRRQGHAGVAGPGEPVPGPARRPPPVVPLPPPLRRRAARAPARRAARRRPGAAPAGERLVRGRTASGPSPSTTPWPPRTSSARPTWSSWRPRRCSGTGRRGRCGAGWRPSPRRSSGSGRCSATTTSGPSCPPVSSRASSRTCGTPSGGWTPCRRTAADLRTGRRTWWSWTRRGSGRFPRRSPCTAPGRRWCSATGPAASPTPGGRWTSPVPTTTSGEQRRSALIGLASWGDGDLEAAQAGYAESWQHMQRAGHIADILGLAITLGDLHIVQGRLGDAMRTYEEALRLAAEQGGPVLRGTADMYVGMAALHRERGRPAGRHRAPAAQPGARRAPRPAAEPPPLAGRDGPGPGGRRRPRRRGRPARRGGAGVRR